jgi:hypothetical protein
MTPWNKMVRRGDIAAEVRQLKVEGITVAPSDAQQMILEMVPDALWEVTKIVEEVDVEHMGPNIITIASQVTVVRVIETEGCTDITIDVLNKETTTEQLHDHPHTPSHTIAGHQLA